MIPSDFCKGLSRPFFMGPESSLISFRTYLVFLQAEIKVFRQTLTGPQQSSVNDGTTYLVQFLFPARISSGFPLFTNQCGRSKGPEEKKMTASHTPAWGAERAFWEDQRATSVNTVNVHVLWVGQTSSQLHYRQGHVHKRMCHKTHCVVTKTEEATAKPIAKS